ncbi:MAG: hypothetical protein JSS14_03730 [Proteobacteria bacterium]|nr:hypothetical protein [Pseudomonadota bacterium]
MSQRLKVLLPTALSLALAGCGATHSTNRAEPYANNEWMQSGANRVANLALRDNLESIRRVQASLYRRNPREWRKWASSQEDATKRVWSQAMADAPLAALNGATGIDAVRVAFDTGYQGDRVAALVAGWVAMLKQANGNTWSQTMIDGVDAENAFRVARNMEISLWLLYARRDGKDQPILLSTEISEQGRNLVVDRELSKVVARLDLLAAQADEKYRRAALDFSQNWVMGSVAPFLQLIPR